MVIAASPSFVAAAPQPVKQGGTAIPLFSRFSLVNGNKSVNLEALNFQVASTTAKISRGFDNFEKNTGTPHPSAVKGARKRASGGLPLKSLDAGSKIWFGPVYIGTPLQVFVVEFDTGSSDLILPDFDCDASCNGHGIYDDELSSTSVFLDEPFTVRYGSGDIAYGYQYTDNVMIVGLTITDQTFGAALHYSHGLQIEHFAPDGLMGMAFQAISEYNQSPVFQTLITQGQTDEPVFAFSFAGPEPELYIGGTNPDMYIGDFSWTPVIQHGFWQVNIDKVVGNEQIVLTRISGIIDTGSHLIHGSPPDVANLYQAIGGTDASSTLGNGYYTFPCSAVPIVSFTFGGTSFAIPAENFNLGASPIDPSVCIGGIITGQYTTWIVGSIFLTSVYTAFDVVNACVGFATLAN